MSKMKNKVVTNSQNGILSPFSTSTRCVSKESGKYITKSKYKAIKVLYEKIKDKGFVELIRNFDGWQVNIYNSKGKLMGDAIEHSGSYGHDDDLLEIYGFGLKEPAGYLTVDEAYKYFEKYLCKI